MQRPSPLETIPIIANWIVRLVSLTDGIRRLVARVFIDEIASPKLFEGYANLSATAAKTLEILIGALTNDRYFQNRFGAALLPQFGPMLTRFIDAIATRPANVDAPPFAGIMTFFRPFYQFFGSQSRKHWASDWATSFVAAFSAQSQLILRNIGPQLPANDTVDFSDFWYFRRFLKDVFRTESERDHCQFFLENLAAICATIEGHLAVHAGQPSAADPRGLLPFEMAF
jgi:hypothetical protein